MNVNQANQIKDEYNKNISQYVIQSVVVVDKGQIQQGKYLNGSPRYANHIPYKAGLVIMDRHNYHRYFLDDFNTIWFIDGYLQKNFPSDYNSYLRGYTQAIQFNMLFEIPIVRKTFDLITTVRIKDLDKYLNTNKIHYLKRNSKKLQKMGTDAEVIAF